MSLTGGFISGVVTPFPDSLKLPGWLGHVAKGLKSLDLSNNGLTTLPSIDRLTSLTVLNVSHNLLRTTDKLISLQKLEELDVSYNELKTLLSLRTLSLNTNLRVLNVHPNPLTYTDRCASQRVVGSSPCAALALCRPCGS